MSTEDQVPAPGRPVRLVPTPPGFWLTLIGVALAAIAPLFGFLIGSTLGSTSDDGLLSPLYWGLFIGVVIGGIGVLMAVFGGLRIWRNSRGRRRSVAAEATT